MKTSLLRVVAVTILGLLVPFVAMQFTSEVDWGRIDFMLMGGLFLIGGASIEIALKKLTNSTQKIVVCIAVVALFLLVWAELAVGVVSAPFTGS